MSSQNKPKIVPPAEWDALYADGKHAELSDQLLHYVYRFGNSAQSGVPVEFRNELAAFLQKFTAYLLRPDFRIPDAHIPLYIHLNAIIASLAACTDFENTDQWLEQLDRQGAPAKKILILYSLQNRYRPSVGALFRKEPALTSSWYAAQFTASYLPAKQWLLKNVRQLYAEIPDDYQVMSPSSVLAGYFAITYLDPENERPFKQKLNAAIKRCQPEVRPKLRRRRKSVAVITKRWFSDNAVYRALYPYLESLVNDYELTLVNLARPNARVEADLFTSIKHFPALKNTGQLVDEQRKILEEQDWGIVYYPDIGMDIETVYLANYRLAPIQIMGYGHPASTHGAEIDYFIAGQESEVPELAEQYFSERLVLLPGVGMAPVWPDYPVALSPRDTNCEAVLINCPWTVFKINADIIGMLRDIVAESPVPVRFRFFAGLGKDEVGVRPVYEQQLREILGHDAVELYGFISYHEFLIEMSKGDLTLIAYPFGGFTTVIDSLHVGVPVIAREGTHGYNRFPSSVLRRAGLSELIVTSQKEFKDKVLQLIKNPEYLANISARIDQRELEDRITADIDPGPFKRAIDYLVSEHENLQRDPSKKPIVIE